MAYDNQIETRKNANRKIRFANFNLNADDDYMLLGNNFVSKKYNAKAENGRIKNSLGIVAAEFLGKQFQVSNLSLQSKLFYYKKYDFENNRHDDKLIIFENNNLPLKYIDLYSSDLSVKVLSEIVFSSVPSFINYRLDGVDVLIMTSETSSMIIWDGQNNIEQVDDCPRISSMIMHYERLFATDSVRQDYLWFSDDLDPRNWSISLDEAGYIEIVDNKGALNKVVSFLDYVYIFKNYGISRLSAFGEQTQFSIHDIYSSMGKIYPESIQVCGDKVVFLSSDGLNMFDGVSTRKVNLKIDNIFMNSDYSNICSCFCNNKYYLAFKYDFGDTAIGEENFECLNNVVFEYDLSNGTVDFVRGLDILNFEVVTTEQKLHLYAVVKKHDIVSVYSIEDLKNNLDKYILFPLYDYAYFDRLKLFKNIYISTKYPIRLQVNYDSKSKTIEVKGADGVQQVPIYLACKYFGFAICSDSDIDVSTISLDYEVI